MEAARKTRTQSRPSMIHLEPAEVLSVLRTAMIPWLLATRRLVSHFRTQLFWETVGYSKRELFPVLPPLELLVASDIHGLP